MASSPLTLSQSQTPEFGSELEPAHPNESMLTALRLRRSTQADKLSGPGPQAAVLHDILQIASRVPDHRCIVPFRFIKFSGSARERAGEILAQTFCKNEPDAASEAVDKERGRFLRAPVIIGVVSKVDENHRTPAWEQILCAGAVCHNMLLAASAHGFAAQWLTEWYAYDRDVLAAFGVEQNEKMAGFIYIGTPASKPKERRRPEVEGLITDFIPG